MRLRQTTRLGAGAASAWTALVVSLLAGVAVGPAPPRVVQILASIALVLSGAEAIRTALGAWRGPVIASFPRRDAVFCDPQGAEAVRAGAQLRGTMGGAGHVHPERLVFPAVAWAAAAVVAAALLRDPSVRAVSPWALAVLAGAAVAACLAPARPFFYREVTGGRVLVFPLVACTRLLEIAAAAGTPRRADDPDPSRVADGWVSSRTSIETRGNSPRADPARHP